MTATSGAPLQQAVVARGAAYGDYDGDGDPDVLITTNNGPARLLRNDGGERSSRLRAQFVGTKSNRDAIGTFARVTTASGASPWQMVKTGSSYLSQSELPLTFGLGTADRVTKIEVKWPDGRTETLPGVEANVALTIEEGKGIVTRTPFAAPKARPAGSTMSSAGIAAFALLLGVVTATAMAVLAQPARPVQPPQPLAGGDRPRERLPRQQRRRRAARAVRLPRRHRRLPPRAAARSRAVASPASISASRCSTAANRRPRARSSKPCAPRSPTGRRSSTSSA